jgi:hypothetical protein
MAESWLKYFARQILAAELAELTRELEALRAAAVPKPALPWRVRAATWIVNTLLPFGSGR